MPGGSVFLSIDWFSVMEVGAVVCRGAAFYDVPIGQQETP
jgi:hypothetical protein